MGTAGQQTPILKEGTVAPQLHGFLRDRIVTCELPPGHRVSETEFAKAFAVSRQPVREAFIKLAEEGLVIVRPQRGTFIRRISAPAVLTARFIREAVEADIVHLVASNATPEVLGELDRQIAQQRKVAEADDPAAFMRLDEFFHQTLAKFAGEASVSDYMKGLNTQMNRVRYISARQFAPSKLVVQHAAIVEAIRAGDAAGAERIMRAHLREIIKDLPQIVEANPDYFEGIEAMS